MDEAQAIFRKKDIENLTHAIFEGAAWIAVARNNYAQVYAHDVGRILYGAFGTDEVNPGWAGPNSGCKWID